MASSDQITYYNDVTETLVNTFGEVISRDVIYTIVESCSGDLNHAANAIMTITSDTNVENTDFNNKLFNVNSACLESGRNGNNKTITQSTSNIEQSTVPQTITKPPISYAAASTSKSMGAIAKQVDKPPQNLQKKNYVNIWTQQIQDIVTYHNKGTRTLIIMRGAPGSGKSYLARQIQEFTVGSSPDVLHTFSTDDFFMTNGVYNHNKFKLPEAHNWNQLRAFEAMVRGISPIIIDNTNIELWEIQPYVEKGVLNGYVIEIVEPNTHWARNLRELIARNIHRVPAQNIKRKIELLSENNITTNNILSHFKLKYHPKKKPPVLRNFPKILSLSSTDCSSQKGNQIQECPFEQKVSIDKHSNVQDTIENCKSRQYVNKSITPSNNTQCNYHKVDVGSTALDKQKEKIQDITDQTLQKLEISGHDNLPQTENKCTPATIENVATHQEYIVSTELESTENIEVNLLTKLTAKPTRTETSNCVETRDKQENLLKEEAKLLEEFEKVENEWDNGEVWEEVRKTNEKKSRHIISSDAKLPRMKKTQMKENFLSIGQDNDWKKISMFMPSWTDSKNVSLETIQNIVEMKDTTTCMEIGDTEISSTINRYKIITAKARDINLNFVPSKPEKIPEKRMFDKSSMTIEPTSVTGGHRCKNEEKHFVRFRNMFKNLDSDDLRDIFEKCCGDVNWAVSIVLDDLANKQLEFITVNELSEIEENNDEEACECIAHYAIIPDISPKNTNKNGRHNILDTPSTSNAINNESANGVKKQKKDSQASNLTLELKRQIEQNIVISDQHYSEHCLKVRKLRRGELEGDESVSPIITTGITMQNSNPSFDMETVSVNTQNTDIDEIGVCEPSTCEVSDADEESDDESIFDEVEESVNVTLGYEFLSQLDAFFGRKDMKYSENIEPKARIPMSLLNEINALWMESLMFQLDKESLLHEEMIKQDEQFARELAVKEFELSKSGKVPDVSDFKEIMDMEYALSLYRKDCEEWQKDRPTDLAAKLSSQKLYNLFPEISPADLDEIHTAHHYDFQTTVEVTLQSQGRTDILEEDNGVSKFVMAAELKRQEKYLAEEKQRLNEEQWPSLPTKIDLDVVKKYRKKANTHLEKREINFKKANEYMRAGMTSVATYYSDIASLHKLKYEQANTLAAASLMHYHASNVDNANTLDLHYMRMKEAKQALDLFLDSHIQQLKQAVESGKRNTLFFITGRGRHSPGGPVIKPAVKKRLKERGLNYCERNPGLVTTKISADDKLSYQLE